MVAIYEMEEQLPVVATVVLSFVASQLPTFFLTKGIQIEFNIVQTYYVVGEWSQLGKYQYNNPQLFHITHIYLMHIS